MRGMGLAVAMALAVTFFGVSLALAQSGNQTGNATLTKTASLDQTETVRHAAPAHIAGAEAAVKAEVRALTPRTLRERRAFERASSTFPAFCRDWERKLHDREVNNLANIAWSERGGYETATFVGYGPIEQ
jgi:hypothetical protein